MKNLNNLTQNKINLDEIETIYEIESYKQLYEKVTRLIENKEIKIIKSSGLNGKSPSLYNRYTIIKNENINDYTEELKYKINPKLNISKYIKKPKLYEKDRSYILMLSKFIDNNAQKLNTKVSINERSFQIWGREKYLSKEGGKTLLKNLGIEESFFNIYDTTEPLAYYSKEKTTPQNILIIENKDTFYSMRNFIINNENILNEKISTIIYGGGKSIYKSFQDFEVCAEKYLTHENNNLLYLGDLDYEGILIYEKLSEIFYDKFNIQPFIKGYEKMIQKYKELDIDLPQSKVNQNKNIQTKFINYFDEETKIIILDLLNKGSYIPQEILNIDDF